MAPHICALLFKPRREDWAAAASAAANSRWALAAAGLSLAYMCMPGSKIKGVGFDDFVKDRRVKAGAAPGKIKGKKPVATSFDAFLNDLAVPAGTAARGPVTGFDHFLKRHVTDASQLASAADSAAASGDGAADVADALEGVPAVEVSVLYGTEYGFAREIAAKVAAALRSRHAVRATVADLAEHPNGTPLAVGTPGAPQAVLLVCSTHGDGVPPPEARAFFDWLASPRAPQSLNGLPYSVCALGDTSYTHFCKAGKALDARLSALGGACVAPRADIDRENWPAVDAWIEAATSAVAAAKLPPRPPRGAAGANGGVNGAAAADVAAAAPAHGKARPFHAALVAKQGLCVLEGPDDKDTVRLEFNLAGSGLSYAPGDALGVYPTNAPEEVQRMLKQLGATGDEQVPAPAWRLPVAGAKPGAKGTTATMALRQALSDCYDLRDPRPTLLTWLADVAGEAGEGDQLAQLLSAGADVAQNAALKRFLEQRHVADILAGVPSAAAAATWQAVLPRLRQLQPRLYSISSSPLEATDRVCVTVAVVRYAALGAPRVGVCSTYLAERLAVGTTAAVYVARNPDFRLPDSLAVPIIMVGPGTGLAPFRAFIAHRQALLQSADAAADVAGEAVLYFGCRHQRKDYLYGEALEAWAAAGAITLHTAFSRDGADKVYVQQRVAETADALFALLSQGAHFYVCGDANAMAGDVDKALRALLGARLPGGAADVDAYVAALEAGGRYQRDVWFS